MAYNPLQQRMADQNQIPASAGVTQGQAADQIANLLNVDGLDPQHTKVEDEEQHARGEAPDDLPLDDEEDDQGLDDDPDTRAGDTSEDDDDEEGGDEEDDDAAQTGKDDQADADDEEGETISTLLGLAEASEIPIEEFLGALSHTFSAAGGEVTATLQELVSGYQLKADYDRDKGDLATRRQTFETEQQSRVDVYTQHAHVLATQFDLVEQALAQRLQDPRLAQLRDYDQAEYLVQVREVEQQVNHLRTARQQASAQYDQFRQENQQAFIQAEGQKLRDSVPDWGDDKLRASVDTIKTLGFSDEEVVDMVDSRFIKGALELATLRTENAALRARIEKGEKAAGTVKQKVPKGIKPGKAKSKTRGPDKQGISRLRRRLSQTNTVADGANVIEAMMTRD